MSQINVELKDYANAKDGSLLIKKSGKWVTTTFEELNQANADKLADIDTVKSDFAALARNSKHFVPYAKSHFLVAYTYVKTKVLSGEIEALDESLSNLDQRVLDGSVSVDEAVEMHPFLKQTFESLYLNQGDQIEFPEV